MLSREHLVLMSSEYSTACNRSGCQNVALAIKLRLSYPLAREAHPVLPQASWDQTPPAVQAYMRALEGAHSDVGSDGAGVAGTAQPDLAALFPPPSECSAPASTGESPQGPRRRGGPPGHPGHTRTLLPGHAVDEVVVLQPDECPSCHAPLAGDAPTPWRHQVIEVPPIPPMVTEYPWHQLVCTACGAGPRPPGPRGCPVAPTGHGFTPRGRWYGGVSLAQTHHPAGDGRAVRCTERVGTVSQLEHTTTVARRAREEARPYVPRKRWRPSLRPGGVRAAVGHGDGWP